MRCDDGTERQRMTEGAVVVVCGAESGYWW